MEHWLTRLHVPMIKKDKKNKSIDDQWKGSNARTHRLGRAALALLSYTKKLQHFHLPLCTFLLKKVNRKVQGVPQAQVAANTMISGSKNTKDKNMSCKHTKTHAGLQHARLTHAYHDSPWKHPLSPKIW